MLKKKAFTMMELVVVIAILAILMAGLAFYGSASVKRTRLQTTESYLKVLASDMEAAFYDYGPYTKNELLPEEEQKEKLESFCKTIAGDYLHTDLDMSTLEIETNGFSVNTVERDPWGSQYKIYYITVSESEGNYLIISPGPDMVSNEDHYMEGKFADDIVLSAVLQN